MAVIFSSLEPIQNNAPVQVDLDAAAQGSAGVNAQAPVGSVPPVIPDIIIQAPTDSVIHPPPEAAQPVPETLVQPGTAPCSSQDARSRLLADATQALEDAKAKERPKKLLKKLGPMRNMMDKLFGFGGTLDPHIKDAFSIVTKACEVMDAREECDSTVETLVNGLADVLPSVEALKHAVRLPQLREVIEELLQLIVDASQFIIDYKSTGGAVLTLRAIVSSSAQKQVDQMLANLRGLKERLDRNISMQTLQSIDSHAKQTLLKELRPVNEAQYDSDRACIPDTRREILLDMLEWAKQVSTSGSPAATRNLLWVHGQAGLGKSAIATSICEQLDEINWLAASFFCKRDDPDRRSPQRVLSTIIFGLAIHHPTYAEAIRNALEEDPTIPGSPMRKQFDKLVRSPLVSPMLAISRTQHVVVIDALDECDEQDRGNLLGLLWSASRLVPWLKVIVTSRPSYDIQAVFDRDGESSFTAWDLFDYNAKYDIRVFVQQTFAQSPKAYLFPTNLTPTPGALSRSEVIDLLVKGASGLFIWARTACEFILNNYDPPNAVKSVQNSTGSEDPSEALNELYTAAVKTRIGKLQGKNYEQARDAVRRCLAAIIVCSSRTPLSIPAMSQLFGEEIPEHVLRSVVDELKAVLYVDKSGGAAVRVYHASFADYLLAGSKSGDLSVGEKVKEQSAYLAERCLEIMLRDLKFNICDLETSYLRNDEVADLKSRVEEKIGPHLSYSCVYWATHVIEATTQPCRSLLHKLISGPFVLYLIEVLSLISKLDVALWSVSLVQKYYQGQGLTPPEGLEDVSRFIQAFSHPLRESTPHLYVSALAFVPSGTWFSRMMLRHFPGTIKVKSGAAQGWARWAQSIDHDDRVNAVACSSDGRRIVSGSWDGTVRAWDAETGAPVGDPLVGHSSRVTSVAYSPDGRHIVSGSSDHTIRVWDAETSALVGDPLVGHSKSVRSVAYSPDGRHVVSGSWDKTVRVWDAETSAPVGDPLVGHSYSISSVACSPDGRRIVSGSWDNTVRVWGAKSGKPVGDPLVGHLGSVSSVAYSPDGRRIISGSSDKTIRVWDAETGAPIGNPLVGHSDCVNSVAYSPDGRHIVSGSWDKTIRVWDADTGAPLGEPLAGHSSSVNSVGYSSDGRRIVSGSWDKTARVWDEETGVVPIGDPLVGHSYSVKSVAYSPDGRRIVSGSHDKTVRVWDAETGAPIGNPLVGHSHWVSSVAYSPDGRRIVSGSRDETVRVWDAETGAPIGNPLVGHSHWVASVAYSSDGRHIISESWNNTVQVWDADTGVPVGDTFAGDPDWFSPVVYSPDGRRIATRDRGHTVSVWDAKSGLSVGDPLVGHSDWVSSVAYSPDGRRIVSGSYDKTVRVWDAETGAPVGRPLVGHSDCVNSVAYSPDGRCIVSGSDDNTVRVWDAELSTIIAYLDNSCFNDQVTSPLSFANSSIGSVATAHVQQSAGPGRLHLGQNVSRFAKYCSFDGWVTTIRGKLLFWLPLEYRLPEPDDSMFAISTEPAKHAVWLDLSSFKHGNDWKSVVAHGGETSSQ
ncbi:hypothetical protein FRC12_008701 [Ceratobasidium sp. 428]|nr:hypothetical protein FRC12_008701 [Ceratobasidium sp. 428]